MTVVRSMNSRLALSTLRPRRVLSSSPAILSTTTRHDVFHALHYLTNPQSTKQVGFATTSIDMGSAKRKKSTAATASNDHGCNDIPTPEAFQTRSSILLERAAKEAKRLLPLAQSHESEFQRVQEYRNSHESFQFAMNAAETLLKVTQSTIDLAESIRNASIQKQPQIVSIHRAFLAVSQLCVSLMMANSSANRELDNRSMEHPLLDYTLQLSLKAHRLGLGFHLPLYQGVCQAIASQETSIHSQSSWILNVARWAQLELGHLPTNFFEEPLLELTRRKKNNETVSILQGMQELQQRTSSLNEKTTKEILLNLKGSIRSMYQKQKSCWTLEEEHCREIILLLESSIWKLVDEQQQPNLIDKPNMLKEAIEGILQHTEQDLSRDSCSQQEDLQELLLEATEIVETLEGVDYFDLEGMDMPLDDPSLLYTRHMECNDIPDISSQLLLASKAKSLRYSPDMERHIYFQFCPMDTEDDEAL